MEKQGRSGILFRCFKEHTKIGLDICAGTCYNIVRKCGHRTSASISAFQAEEVGSIPIARSILFRRWFVKNQRLSVCSDPVFDPHSIPETQKRPFPRKTGRGPLFCYIIMLLSSHTPPALICPGVDVHPAGFTTVNHFNIICQICKVGRQYGRRYYRFHNSYTLSGYMNYNKQI